MKRSAAIAAMALGLSLLAGRVLAACVVSPLAQLPVTMSDLQPMVPAKINGADALFIVDSGAFYSLISPSSASQYGLQLKPTTFGARMVGIGGETDLSFTTVKRFTLPDAPIPDLNFLVGGAEPGGGAAGLLGRNVLGIGDVEYDLANGVIRLMRPKGCGGAVLAYWAGAKPYSVMDVTAASPGSPPATGTIFAGGGEIRATTGAAFINGVRIRATFDTGAGTSVLSLHAAARAGVKPDGAGVVYAGVGRGIGRRTMETWIAPFASFKIGDEEIRNTRLRIGDLALGEDAEMLIGADFFLSHRVYVANSQHKLYFTYNGGPVFNLDAAARVQAAADEAPKAAPPLDEGRSAPTTAEGFGARGAAFAARKEFEQAIADFTRASEMAPGEPSYFYQRGMARWASGRPELAMADLDKSLKLKPDDVEARMARAELRLSDRDTGVATADLDAAARFATRQGDARLDIARLYERLDQLEPAIAQYSLWIATHPQDSRLAQAMNGRCRARALTGQDLDKALVDCNAALRIYPKSPDMLDSRGLVRLRQGDFDRAIADYDASLNLRPASAWSLYGRGLAKLRKGLKAKGEADLAAANLLQPGVADEMKKYGVTP